MSAPAQDDLPARRTHPAADPGPSNPSHPDQTNPPATDDAWAAEDVDIPDGLSELFTTLPPPFSTSRSGSSSRRELASAGNDGGAASVHASSSSTPIATPATPSEQLFTLDALLGPPARAPHRRTPSQSRRTSAWRDSSASSALGMSFPNGRIGDQPQTSSDRDHPRDRDEPAWNGLATARAYYDSRSRMGAGQFARLETLTDLIDRNRHQPGRSSGERAPVRARLPPGPRTDSQGGPSSTLFNSLVRPVPTTSTSAATATATTSGPGTSTTNERMATTVLRRRNGEGMRLANRAAYSFDPSDIAPPGGSDDHIWDILGDPDSDDDMWGIYRTGDGEDVDGWGDPPEGGASLSRGRNNRRRSRHEDDSMSIDFSPRFQPTNNSAEGSPIVVGRRRRRSAGTAPLKDANDMASKKRKCATPTLPPARPDYLRYTSLPETSELPNDFMDPPRSSHLEVTYDGDRPVITFGEQHRDQLQDSESDACALRANRSIPTGIGVHYYEVEVLDAGRLRYVSVGWMSATSTLNRLVGWDRGTWGFHCDDGNSFAGQNHGNEFTEPWGSGDIVGVGIDFSTGRAFFTRNGALVGNAFADLPQHLFPAVGMRSPRESVRVNFAGPFVYDIDTHVAGIAERVRAQHVPERWRFSAPAPETRIPKLVGVSPSPPQDAETDQHDASDGVLGSLPPSVLPRGKAKGKAPVSPVNGLPADSPLRDPAFRAETAFVLDHLQQNGHGRALSLLKEAMGRRGWVRPSPSSDGKGAQDLTLFLAALREGRVERGLIPPLRGRLGQRLAVHELAQVAAAAAAGGAGDMADEADTRALELGRAVRARERSEGWAEPEAALLGHAVALLAGRNAVAEAALAAARAQDAAAIERTVRAELGLRPRSALSLAVAQMRLITDKLGDAGDGEAPFLGVDRLLPSAAGAAGAEAGSEVGAPP